ncbi:MAG TPA: nucleoid-associated protein [Chitinophagaceae bacterium]|nr:nucleoid-associated protein [Chitinophagaceae bacterium]
MISGHQAILQQLSIHKTGNKQQGELYTLSDCPAEIKDEVLNTILLEYFLKPFEKVNERYKMYHTTNELQLNEVYHFAELIFNDTNSFHDNTKQVAKHLYDISNHPKIKGGELYITYYTGVQLDGELFDAIGIFKSENKETYLKVERAAGDFALHYENDAVNIKKLDKGCLIFNTNKENGYIVAAIDQTNRNTDAVYWIDDFLKLKILNDEYTQTNNTLQVYKAFVTQGLEDMEVPKTDKIDLLNRSMKYFKEKENFNLDEFASEVIVNPVGVESFKKFKTEYEEEYDLPAMDSFQINNAAVKKQSRVYKSVLKLDRNFHIYIHGNNELIERGFDEHSGKHFYKIYFDKEA